MRHPSALRLALLATALLAPLSLAADQEFVMHLAPGQSAIVPVRVTHPGEFEVRVDLDAHRDGQFQVALVGLRPNGARDFLRQKGASGEDEEIELELRLSPADVQRYAFLEVRVWSSVSVDVEVEVDIEEP